VRIPSSTYRLQFSGSFRFADGEAVLSYLHDLGISDVYSSPILKARAGSPHGYDVTDPTQIQPEIGTLEDFERFAKRRRENQLGFVLDIVPNHMAASTENPWWMDVLTNGQSSLYAEFFDIDWKGGKVLLPILAKPYGECLESGDFAIQRDNGHFTLRYKNDELPVHASATVATDDIDTLDRVLASQPYRLAYWRKAADAINYRRFFDVADLVGLRAERKSVFTAMHAAIMDWVHQGFVDGLRIDHIDGLLDPMGYLERLPPVYIVVEKILGSDERLPLDWPTHGTTGYDFLNDVNGVLIDSKGYQELQRIYGKFTGAHATAVEIFRSCKRQVMKTLFNGELLDLSKRLIELAQDHRTARDLSLGEIREALVSVTACLSVYRTYITDSSVSGADRERILQAIQAAGCNPLCNALDFVREVLTLEPPYYLENHRERYFEFVKRWQQFTGPVMAKGLEDTTFYVHNPLVSVNEVGRDPNGPEAYFGVDEFHRRNAARREQFPLTLNTTSTHDTKRCEDVRSRINVLSELSDEWEHYLHRWSRWNRSATAPDADEQVLIYQTLLGAWPISQERLHTYLIKALREAKTHTNWLQPDENYEQAVLAFVDRLLDPNRSKHFLRHFYRFQEKIAYFGALNSLSQLLLKIASPGIPDIYQGTELWDFSLADPDNRRPVDFDKRIHTLRWLKRHAKPSELLNHWEDGRIKLFITWKALSFRRDHLSLFLDGEYLPLAVKGRHAEHVVAFARHYQNEWALIIAPRLTARLTRPLKPPLGIKVWEDTSLVLPANAPQHWHDVFTSETVATDRVADILCRLPLALLHAEVSL